ncbi:MAG: nuclear transport factor 2 family protein [Dehalococcoidales bacterium]|nr:nuclear transport factor 2 family protein [Dehalococcoidales bacterium]
MSLEELEKRLAYLEDQLAIRDLHHEYLFQLNNKQWDDIIETFTEDGWAHIGHHGKWEGKDQVTKLFKERISQMNAGREIRDAHNAIDPVIEINGNKAKGHWLMYIFISNPDTNETKITQGRHDCEYEKIDGKWKFKSVKYTRPWPRTKDTMPEE